MPDTKGVRMPTRGKKTTEEPASNGGQTAVLDKPVEEAAAPPRDLAALVKEKRAKKGATVTPEQAELPGTPSVPVDEVKKPSRSRKKSPNGQTNLVDEQGVTKRTAKMAVEMALAIPDPDQLGGENTYQVEQGVLDVLDPDDIAEQIRLLQGRTRLVGREFILVQSAIGQCLEVLKGKLAKPEFFPWVYDQFHYSERHAWRLIFLHRNRDKVLAILEEAPESSLRGVLEEVDKKLKLARAQGSSDSVERRGEGPVPDIDTGENCFIEVGDARDLPMGEGMVDLIVTSPPYGLGLEGVDATTGYQMYLEEASVWAAEMYRVANNAHGRLCINLPLDTFRDEHKLIVSDWYLRLTIAGWQYHGLHLWDEGNVSKRTAWGSFRKPTGPNPIMPVEVVLVMFKGEWLREPTLDYEPEVESQNWRDWMTKAWDFPGGKHPRHKAVYPVELPKRAILLYSFPGDVILDPFVGVGTTCVAAKGLRRQAYGYDTNEEWVQEAKTWAAETPFGKLSDDIRAEAEVSTD